MKRFSKITKDMIVFECAHFVIADISDYLPRHRNWPYGTSVLDPTTGRIVDVATGAFGGARRACNGKYYKIEKRPIKRCIYHQTAGSYTDGFAGVLNTAVFFVRDPAWHWNGKRWNWTGTGRGWPGFAYSYFVNFEPLVHLNRSVIWKCNHHDLVTFHTGDGCNENGLGVAFQGYFRSEANPRFEPLKGTDGKPSAAQLELAEAFWVDYAQPVAGAQHLETHAQHGKPTCPGDEILAVVSRINTQA